jgi:hypothetical protein
VSKRRGSHYARGRSSNWLTVKNPGALAVRPGHEGRKALGQMSTLILRRASENRPDDYSVFHEGQRVGRIYRLHSSDRELWYWAEIGVRAPNQGATPGGLRADTATYTWLAKITYDAVLNPYAMLREKDPRSFRSFSQPIPVHNIRLFDMFVFF